MEPRRRPADGRVDDFNRRTSSALEPARQEALDAFYHDVCYRQQAVSPIARAEVSDELSRWLIPLAAGRRKEHPRHGIRKLDAIHRRSSRELAALADGSLAPDRRAALEARVAASPELADLLAEQERAVAFTRSAAAEVEAPASLRARIDASDGTRSGTCPAGPILVGVAAAAVVAVAIGCRGRPGDSGERFHAALAATDARARRGR